MRKAGALRLTLLSVVWYTGGERRRWRSRNAASSPCCSPTSSATRRSPSTSIRRPSPGSSSRTSSRSSLEIEAFGGRVDKVLGDAIIALFGAPVAHEDDADRAVRAALRMQETLARLVAERADAGDEPVVDIQMRIGINTGEVLVGTVAGSDYTAMGDVVNTASRLQALTPPGSVLIGEATEALCSAAVAREPFGVTQIRGRQQAEQPWVVTGAAAAGSRPVRCDIPFVGRLDELALLESTISLVRTGHSGVVSIVGEPGCGKTRLADHIVTGLADEAIVLETACSPYGETSLWSPLRNGLATLLALEPDANPDDVRRTVEQRSNGAVVAATRRRPARATARRHRLPVRSSVRARRARPGRRAGIASPAWSPRRCAATPRRG